MDHRIFSVCEEGDLDSLKEILETEPGAVNARDRKQFTPLHAVASTDLLEVAVLLLDKGADINAKNDFGVTPLHIANYPEMTELLIQRGASLNAIDKEGNTPLISLAGDQDGYDSMEVLLNAGASPRLENQSGESARDIAVSREEDDKIQLLKEFGA